MTPAGDLDLEVLLSEQLLADLLPLSKIHLSPLTCVFDWDAGGLFWRRFSSLTLVTF